MCPGRTKEVVMESKRLAAWCRGHKRRDGAGIPPGDGAPSTILEHCPGPTPRSGQSRTPEGYRALGVQIRPRLVTETMLARWRLDKREKADPPGGRRFPTATKPQPPTSHVPGRDDRRGGKVDLPKDRSQRELLVRVRLTTYFTIFHK